MSFEKMAKIKIRTFRFLLIIWHYIISVRAEGPSADYCFLQCKDRVDSIHKVCKRLHRCNVNTNKCKEYNIDENFRKKILDLHNKARNELANGDVRGSYGNTGAKNMNALSYDLELEYFSSCVANDCKTLNKLDGCLNSQRFPAHASSAMIYNAKFGDSFWNDAMNDIKSSMNYIGSVNYIHGFNYEAASDDLSFYNLYWADAKYVGCTAILYKSSDKTGILQCTYAPVEYKEGSPVYKMATSTSEIASECREGKNKDYSSLCGVVQPIPKGKMWTLLNSTNDNNLSKKMYSISFFTITMVSLSLIFLLKYFINT
ncbi:hypothetical protein WA026_011779 [Henosepilachna vigintioctopunctata]|uniref:SCP domain-containing protein n=1 Tax=Henosepilachna vigintioctopunctata TaxID=420089 RepID=A0AAW1U9Z4_9CUCU